MDVLARVAEVAGGTIDRRPGLGPGLAGLLLWLIRAQWGYAIVAVTGLASATLYRVLPAPRASSPAR